MRKLCLILLVMVIALSSIATMNLTSIDTETFASGQYVYSLDEQGNAIILNFIRDEQQTSLTIPSFLDDYPVTRIEKKAIDCDRINELILPDSICSLAEGAFYNCQGLVYLSLPCSLSGSNGFVEMENVKSLDLSYGQNGFMPDYDSNEATPWYSSKDSIETINIDAKIKYLGNYCFANMSALSEINIADSVEGIGKYCFYNDNALIEVKLPYQLNSIGDYAFNGDSLGEGTIIIVPQNISYLGEDCFNSGYSYYIYNNSKVSDYFSNHKIEYNLINLSFLQDSYDIELGEKEKLSIVDASIYSDEVVFTSSNQSVLTIDQNGVVQTHGTGTAQVIVSTSTGNNSTIVNVYAKNNEATHKFKDLSIDDTYQINPLDFAEYMDNSISSFSYESDNEETASVNEGGLVTTYNKQGRATIKIVSDTGLEAYYLFNVVSYVTNIEVTKDPVNMRKGNYYDIGAKVYPKGADNKQLIYTSSDESVATVSSNGRIYALKNGSSIITVSATDGSGITAQVAINVTSATVICANPPIILKPEATYRLRASINDGSKLSFVSTDESIATVDETGAVRGVNVGECNIVIYNDRKTAYKTIKCVVYDAFSYGIDISEWNGRYYTIENFQKIKNEGIDFAYIRCSLDNGYKDPIFERNYALAKEAGLDVGAYHYLKADTVEGAIAEAKWTLKCIQGKKFEYPIMLDIEDQQHKPMSYSDWNAVVKAYCDVIEAAGYKAIIYSYASMLSRNNTQYENYVANWFITAPDFDKPYTIWQFTSVGKVNGINNNCDMDICFFDYPTYIKENHLNGY